MSFTQKYCKNINPDRAQVNVSLDDYCNGCNAKCELGFVYVSHGLYLYPKIGESIIAYYYVNKNRKKCYVGVAVDRNRTVQQVFQQEKSAKSLAGKIARLCDHYKTR